MRDYLTVSKNAVLDNIKTSGTPRNCTFAVLILFSAGILAYLIHLINETSLNQPEKAVQTVGWLFLIVLVLPIVVYVLWRRGSADFWELGFITLATVGLLAFSVYVYWVSFFVTFPADILIWSESDFVNDILKFRVGYPIFSPQENNDSFIYPPGTQLLTYFIAWLLGHPDSIPVYRAIQVFYSLLAAFVALLCCRRLVEMSSAAGVPSGRYPWEAVWFPVLFLIATNSLTNPFSHNLHNDALAQLISVLAYYLLVSYASTRNQRLLVLLAILPAAGFLVKQSLAIWAILYSAYLAFFDRLLTRRRLAIFSLCASGGVVLAIVCGYLIWEEPFTYWIFTVMGYRTVSFLRSIQHALDAWAYLFIGLFGGFIILRGQEMQRLFGLWAVWLFLILAQAYTSGIAWMLNHLGPGSLIAGIWFTAAVTTQWPCNLSDTTKPPRLQTALRAAIVVGMLSLLLNGMDLIRIPAKPVSDDVYRYVEEIEREFEEGPPDTILLDMGTWIYLKEGMVMKDRAPSIGDRGYSGTGDFTGIIRRFEQNYYSKILVRNLHSWDFWYDYGTWQEPSGIRTILLENYRETAKISSVDGYGYGFGEISILVPSGN